MGLGRDVLLRGRELYYEKFGTLDVSDCSHAWIWLNWVQAKIMATDNPFLKKATLRPNYTWGLLHAAYVASILEIPRISVIEFGVAGGRGLVAMDRLSKQIAEYIDVQIDVYGFDMGGGLPKPRDERDLPNLWSGGEYPMDVNRLQAELQDAKLILGDVGETVGPFLESNPAPIGFIAIDVDYYTSSVDALQVLNANLDLLMPRVLCYLDDVHGFTFGACNGELAAVNDFTAEHPRRPISKIPGLRFFVGRKWQNDQWPESMFMCHLFDHPKYNDWDGLIRLGRLDL